LRCASGSGFDTWGLVGSLAALIIGMLVHLFKVHRNNRMQKKGRSTMTSSRKAKYSSRKKNYSSRKQQIKQHAIEAVGAAGAGVFGDQLAS
jgi:hypothetical protein